MVGLLYDGMTQAPVGTIGEEVWILPPVFVVEKVALVSDWVE